MKIRTLIFSLGLPILVISCDSGVSVDNIAVPVNLVGLIKLEPNSTNTDFSRAVFGRIDNSLTPEIIESSFMPLVDTCLVEVTQPSISSPVPTFNIFEQQVTLMSAGESVVITSDAGTYATLIRDNMDPASPFYKTEVALDGLSPVGLIADIPGDDFPGFSDIQIKEVPSLQITSPVEGELVKVDTQFTWNANDVATSVFEVNVGGYSDNNELISISCTIIDDGSFTFPESTREEMGAEFESVWASYLRIAYTVSSTDEAIVFTANSVEND